MSYPFDMERARNGAVQGAIAAPSAWAEQLLGALYELHLRQQTAADTIRDGAVVTREQHALSVPLIITRQPKPQLVTRIAVPRAATWRAQVKHWLVRKLRGALAEGRR